MVKQIELTQGKVALVDDADFEWLSQWNWCADHQSGENGWYARRGARLGEEGQWTKVRMHQEILAVPHAHGAQQVDHRDGNGLNNQRSNLRICTHDQNCRNRQKASGLSSQYKGVYWDKERSRWHAQIKQGGIRYHLGRFDQEIDAGYAYDTAARERFGKFACTNFAQGNERPALAEAEV